MALKLIGVPEQSVWQVGSTGTYVFAIRTSAAGAYRIDRYKHASGLANTEGVGNAWVSSAFYASRGIAVSADTVWAQRHDGSVNTLYLLSIDPSTAVSTGVGSATGEGTGESRIGWNGSTGTVWGIKGELYEWVGGTTKTSRSPSVSGTSIPHADSTGGVWFARDGASNLYEVCRYSGGTVSVIYSFTRTSFISITGAQQNPGVIYNDEFIFNENGTWKQVTVGGVVTTSSVMANAPVPSASYGASTYVDSYCAGPDNNGGFVMAFEGRQTTVREVWGFLRKWWVGSVGRVA